MKVSEGIEESGIVVGNTYDKYGSANPIVRWIMSGFKDSLTQLVDKAAPLTISEIGCGEGYWVMQWNQQGIAARGSDFSVKVLDMARKNAIEQGLSEILFQKRSIYDLTQDQDGADLVVCCELMEHLEDPELGLEQLQKIVTKHLVLSVPQEPIWRVLNILRGKYLTQLGNTPGHIQHWSRAKFIQMVSNYFEIVSIKTPFPWTMLLCCPKDKKSE